MTDKVIGIEYDKCTGCRICEAACAISNCGESNPAKARIRSVRIEEEAGFMSIPVVCMKCINPLCKEICPMKAISDDPKTGARQIDKDKCIGCSACVYACPFGAIFVDRSAGHAVTCTQCDGDPICVRFCPTGAILYLDGNEVGVRKQRAGLDKYISFIKITEA